MKFKSHIIILFSLIPLITFSQDYSTWGEIYDYEIGDMFHFNKYGEGPNLNMSYEIRTIVQVIGKSYSDDMDTVYYVMSVKKISRNTYNPEWEFESLIERFEYHHLDLPFICDTTYVSGFYNGRTISYFFHFSYNWLIEEEYAEGCGQVTIYQEDFDLQYPSFSTKSMVYFKKGQEEWGDPLNLTSVEDHVLDKTQIVVFPNPACDVISISINSNLKFSRLVIYSNIGILFNSTDESFEQINISHFPPGLYIIKAIGDGFTTSRKLIVQ